MTSIRSMVFVAFAAMAPIAGFSQDMPPAAPTPAAQATEPLQPTPPVQPTESAPAPVPASESVPPVQASTPPAATAPAAQAYSAAQLDQLLAPVALYPDTLLGDVLMAATYPVQIVEAQRWLAVPANAALKGDQLVAALQPMTWDPSVKSLVPFPEVINQMGDKLDWTEALGTAFVNQQTDVMAQVQVLRHQAESCGKLASTPQQRVSHQGPAVVIQPANPAVVYVPVYNPAVVYGVWAYPAYPPFFFVPNPLFFVGPVGVDIGFTVGFGIVGPFWGWGYPVWGSNHIFIDGGRWSHISFNHARFAGSEFRHVGAVGRVGAASFHAPGAGRFGAGRSAGRFAAHNSAARGAVHTSAARGAVHTSAARGAAHTSAARGAAHTSAARSAGSRGAFGRSGSHAAARSAGNFGRAASRGGMAHAAMSRGFAGHNASSHAFSGGRGRSAAPSHGGGTHRH